MDEKRGIVSIAASNLYDDIQNAKDGSMTEPHPIKKSIPDQYRSLAFEVLSLLIEKGPTPKNVTRALELFNLVIETSPHGDPSLIAALYGASAIYFHRGDYQTAKRLYLAACSMEISLDHVHFSNGDVYR